MQKLDHRTKQHTQFGVSASNGSRDMARTKLGEKKEKKKKKKEKKNEHAQNYISSPTGIANEEINKANWMVSYSAKLDRSTKQHSQFGVSASNGSRDMARTKSWQTLGWK